MVGVKTGLFFIYTLKYIKIKVNSKDINKMVTCDRNHYKRKDKSKKKKIKNQKKNLKPKAITNVA